MATEFDADLRLLPTAESGRKTALRSGYRSHIRFGDADGEAWGIEITFEVPTDLAPGDSALVHMTAWADPPAPSAGTVFRLYEGSRLVGAGTGCE